MRRSGCLLASGALALGMLGAERTPPGVLLLEVQERRSVAPSPLQRRAPKTVEEVITNEKARGGYFSTCSVGTPPQDVVLLLDTGSSDTWIPASNAAVCSRRFSTDPCPLGSFNPSDSETYREFIQDGLEITYLDESYVFGDYFQDTFDIGDSSVKNMTLGLGLNTTLNHGIVGIGYMLNEASVRTSRIQYDNLPVALAKANVTNSVAYSLWLNDFDSQMGNILFGGVDVEKYTGSMMSLNVTTADNSDEFDHFRVPLTSVQASSPSGSDTLTTTSYPIQVVLDSGTTLSSLPADLVDQMWREVGVDFSAVLRQPLIPCYRKESPGSFTFGFGGPDGPKVIVPMNELVLDITLGQPPVFPSDSPYKGQDACLFGIQDFGGPPYILGGTFLRSAYVVFDIVNNQVGMAQTDFNETKSNIVPFPSYGAAIPSATAAPNQGQTDTPPSGTAPDFSASTGFQNAGWIPGALQLPAILAISLAFWAAF
ncbi:related to acid proteinase PEPI precursor [Cephalotrichum gorgonifer]|uniref:Related to acid proteinase PEPI n=1 Tax=Cephalotrichum gorgonifer TaxID=2041049 RepID=A0AAE8SZK4_9PEZI|nr:related to acid proteinase PEPI precursor [Cephalotrichum gorgonifer]